MSDRTISAIGAVLAGLAVLFGAFGAHGLESRAERWPAEDRLKRLENWETAARYQMYHGLALLFVGAQASGFLANRRRALGVACWGFGVGAILFSGSLYLYSLTGITKFGAITPLGGLAWLIAWLSLAIGLLRRGPATAD